MKRKKIMCISSHGGHLHELKAAVKNIDADFCWCTHKTDATKASLEKFRHHFIIDPCTSKFKFGINSIQALGYLMIERPDVVISTGAGIAIPTMIFAKWFFGSKLIFVESAANVIEPSRTGRFIYKYCNLFLIQWEGMQKFYPKAKFVGLL